MINDCGIKFTQPEYSTKTIEKTNQKLETT
jgi:hypothetical protein